MEQTTKTIVIKIDASQAVAGGREAQRALEAIEKQTKQSAEAIQRMESGLDFAVMVAKITAGVYVVKEFTDRLLGIYKAARDAASGIQDFSEQLGVSTDFVQGSMLAAAQNTVSIDKLGQAYTRATQTIGQAAQGQKDGVELMNTLGVKILDAGGKLRSTERILQDAAAGILRIEDPAKRVTVAMDFFGKSGAQIIPMLSAIAAGSDVMASRAAAAGALIEDTAIKQLAKLKSNSEEASLKWNALAANLGAPIATAAMEAVNRVLGEILSKIREMRSTLPQQQRDVNIRAYLRDNQSELEAALKERTGLERSIASTERTIAQNPNRGASRTLLADQRQQLDAKNARIAELQMYGGVMVDTLISNQIGPPQEPPPVSLTPGNPGGSNPAVKGAGEDVAERIRKLKDTLNAAAAAQEDMTKAARKGEIAFFEQQAAAEATAKAIEVFGGKVSAADPKVKALAETLQKPIFEKMQGAAAQAFVVQTTELEKQNDVLAAQIALMNEAPEIQARELALIKSKQEAQKAGKALSADDIENRRKAIEQNETLKLQAEQLKKAQELWTEPLRQALRNIQTIGADAFDQLLQSGNISFQSLGQAFSTTIRRMAAEFLALATVRPVMSVLVSGATSLGIVSPAQAGQLGFPQEIAGAPSHAGVGAGGGLGGMNFGGGGLGSMLPSGWTNMPVFGGIDSEIANWSSYGSASMGAQGLFSANATWGQALGGIAGLAGIGMGAFQLANARGPGGIVSGAAGIIGGGLGIAAAAFPALASTLGPIGLGVGLLGMIGGSLLGNGGKEIPPAPPLNYGMGNFYESGAGTYLYGGGSMGPGQAMTAQGTAMGKSLLSLYRQAGLKPVAGRLIGGELSSVQDSFWNGDSWQQNGPRSQIALIAPGNGAANVERIAHNANESMEQAADLLFATVFGANLFRGGVTGGTPSLKTAFGNYSPSTKAEVETVVSMTTAYDKLGKAMNPVKDALDKVSASFDDLTDFAKRAGLSLEPINAELEKQTKRTAQDFIDNMLDPLAVQMRALADERASALESAKYIAENVKDVYVDMDRIATFYTNKEAALRDQFYQGSVTALQNLINRLTYGDLANASPDTSLAGTRATYTAMLAKARAGDSTAITGLAGVAEAYTGTARNYFASGPEYAALVAQIRKDLEEVVGTATGGAAGGAGAAAQLNQASAQLVAANDQLRGIVQQQSDQITDLKSMVTELAAQLGGLVANRMRGIG